MTDNTRCFNMDCMVGMKEFPDKHFDLAIVDPPYGLGLDMVTGVDSNARQKRRNGSVVKHEEKDWNDAVPTEEYFTELHRVSKHQIIWGCNYYAKYIPAKGRIVHDKIMGTEDTAFNWSHADLASCSLFNRIVMYRYQWAGNKQNGTINWHNLGLDARIHPTQKPVALYKWLLKNYAKEGDKILDTHGGSMSSVIACLDMGYSITCYEMDTDYYNQAKNRITNHLNQLNAFRPAYDIEFHDNSGVSRLRNQQGIGYQEQKDLSDNQPIHRIDGLFHGDTTQQCDEKSKAASGT